MGADDSAVDHCVFIVGIAREMLEDPPPHPFLGPPAVAPMGVLPIAESLWHVAPGDAGAIAIEHGFDEAPVVLCGNTRIAKFAGQQVPYPFPLVVAQSISGHRSACPQPTFHQSHKIKLE
jgi:hypothetical protein